MTETTRLRRWLLPLLILGVLVVASCAAPPDGLQKSVDALPEQIETARGEVGKAKAAFDKKLSRDQYAFIKAYTAEEQHRDRFKQALAKLKEAEKVYNGKVVPIVDEYEDAKLAKLKAAVAEVNKLKGAARTLMNEPSQWVDKVATTKSNPKATLKQSVELLQGIKAAYVPIQEDVTAAKKTYSKNADVIGRKFQPLTDLQTDAIQANGLLQAEAAKSSPNYAVMTEHATAVQNKAASFKKDASAFAGKLAKLDVRETHTLIDLRVDTRVIIARYSWNESYDFPDEHSYTYTSLVDMETGNHFARFGPEDVVASDGWSGFSTSDGVDRRLWDKLQIDPQREMHSDDDSAEFYVDEIDDTYCHKLQVMKDGKPDVSGRPAPADNYCSRYDEASDVAKGIYWVEADDLNAEAIGMDIYAKGLGDFEDQATTEATPPGMVYVGDPATGEWKKDENGNSFWAFYGQYMFFSQLIGGPNPYHYRSEYNTWNSGYRYNDRPYFAGSNGAPRYGAKSPMMQSRFPNSSFNRTGLRNATIRNAGPVARAGGPGGGGK